MNEQFVRTAFLFGEEALDKLRSSKVIVFGVGGVGGYVVEALARGGVGSLTLVDHDTVDLSNINRQIVATHSTIGQLKVEVAKKRVEDINPECEVETYPIFYLPETVDQIDLTSFDYIVDAVDTVTAKLFIATQAHAVGVPLISSMGAGNKLDPTRFRVSDISQTTGDKLARIIRKECRKRGIGKFKVVYSDEEQVIPLTRLKEKKEGATSDINQGLDRPQKIRRKDTPGSTSFVPSVAGLIVAGEVLKDLTVVERAKARAE